MGTPAHQPAKHLNKKSKRLDITPTQPALVPCWNRLDFDLAFMNSPRNQIIKRGWTKECHSLTIGLSAY